MLELEQKAFGEALKRGLGPLIANGSDAGGYAWDQPLARELGLLVEYGMTPMQAIKAATATAARLLGQEANLGTIAQGRYADLIAVAADPLADIRSLGDVRWVMKGGAVHLTR
jgi:imidazolonepropionase-like amidohydrolase